MVRISRSFSAVEHFEGTSITEFEESTPANSILTVVHVNDPKNELMVVEHKYPVSEDHNWSSRTWIFEVKVSDWEDISELILLLEYYKELPDDVKVNTHINADEVVTSKIKTVDDELESQEYTYVDVEISFLVSSTSIELALIPEPNDLEKTLFPSIPIGKEYAREGQATDDINLQRLIELLIESEHVLEGENTSEPTLRQEDHAELSDNDYGHEVIRHAQDGDICVENGLLHLALSSYIHAIEWTAIAYLKERGIDILEKEENGEYYNFAGGRNSILDELRENSNINQKMVSQLERMNRAERRWMAHHKSGQVLPEEVDAIRARLVSLIQELFINS